MRRRILIGATLLCALMSARSSVQAQTSYSVTVQSGAHQTFTGFGASETDHYSDIPATPRGQMDDMVYRDLHAKVLRLWVGSDPSTSEASMKSNFYSSYVNTGVISEITSRGVT